MYADEVLPQLIARRAIETPDRLFLVEPEGTSVTYGELDALGRRWAAAMYDAGLRDGDRVVTVLPPSIAAVAAWLGLSWLRATPVAINPALRGQPLRRAFEKAAAAACLVADVHLAPVVALADSSTAVGRLFAVGADPTADIPPGVGRIESYVDAVVVHDRPGLAWEGPARADTATVLFTSGTTGLPKAVAVSWAQLRAASTGHIPVADLSADDVWYSPFPMFHVGGLFPIYVMAIVGGRVVLRDRFRTSRFWQDIRINRCTATLMFGATVAFLLDAAPTADDADNPLRKVIGYFPRTTEFVDRFGIERLYRAYNQTEMSVPIATAGAPDVPDSRTCGRAREGYQVRLVGDDGHEVVGAGSGELVVRAADPLALAQGYVDDPQATADLWRGGWLHSGDVLRRDEAGWFYFVDRTNDFIRRRGENISCAEIEMEVMSHPGVHEAAAIGLPSADGDQEIKLLVVLKQDRELTESEVSNWLAERLPEFMLPRYIEMTGALPRTETEKVRKGDLRAVWMSERTWDRTTSAYLAAPSQTTSRT